MTTFLKKYAALRKRQAIIAWDKAKRFKFCYAFLAPYAVLFLTFYILPMLTSIYYSFTYNNIIEPPKFIGASNYINLILQDDVFLIAIKNTFIFACIVGPSSYIMSYLVAWFINELPPKIRALVTLIFYAPSISGQVYLIWGTLFSSDSYGWANATLEKLGLIDAPINWFKDETYVMPLCIVVSLWTSLGTSFLSFIAGLQGIDRALFEAGAVDGVKNRWQELYYITLPTMRPQMMLGAILAITGAFGFGGVITALVGFPSPNYVAHTIMHHLDDYGGMRFEMGYASAIATLLFLMMIGCNMLVTKILRKIGT